MRHRSASIAAIASIALAAAALPAAGDPLPFTGTLSIWKSSGFFVPEDFASAGGGVAESQRFPSNEVRGIGPPAGFDANATTLAGGTGWAPSLYSLDVSGVDAASFTGQPTPLRGVLAVRGVIRVKSWHGATLDTAPLTVDGSRGFGLGGTIPGWSVPPTGAAFPDRVDSLRFGLWTTGTAKETGVYTPGGVGTLSAMGFDLRTPDGRGFVQLVAPMRATGGFPEDRAAIAMLRLEFGPEPGRALALGAGAATLLWMGRQRRRRPSDRVSG